MVGAMNMANIAGMGSSMSMSPLSAMQGASGLIGSLGGLGLGIFNAYQSSQQAEFEREMAQKNYELQRANYEKTWDWNYNKMQYAKADYENAGFNPVLAAGAQQSTLTPNAPQYDTSGSREARSQEMQSYKNIQDILFKNRILQDMAEIRKIEADISRSDSEALLNAAKLRHTYAGARYFNSLADKSEHDIEIYKERGTPTNEPYPAPFRAFEAFLDEYGLLGGALSLLGFGGFGKIAEVTAKGTGLLANALKNPEKSKRLFHWLKKQGKAGMDAAEMLYKEMQRYYRNFKWW